MITEDIASLFSVSESLCGGLDLEVKTLDDSSWPLKWIEPDDYLQIYSDDTSLAGQTIEFSVNSYLNNDRSVTGAEVNVYVGFSECEIDEVIANQPEETIYYQIGNN